MTFDDIIEKLGDFTGKHQIRTYVLLCLPAIVCGFQTIANVFLQAESDYRCLLPHEHHGNATYYLSEDEWEEWFDWDSSTETFSTCSLKDSEEECEDFVYDTETVMKTSFTFQFNLVCGNKWKIKLSDTLYHGGTFIGSVLYGSLADRFGRKKTYIFSLVFQALFAGITIFSPNWWCFALFRMGIGINSMGTYLISYVLAIEMIGPKYRFVTGTGTHFFFCIGYASLSLIGYLIRNHQYFQLAITVPAVALIPTWWFLNESIRWLIAKHKIEEALKVLMKIAKTNKIQISEEELSSMLNEEHEDVDKKVTDKMKIYQVCCYKKMRYRAVIIFFCFTINNMTYYGLSWEPGNLSGNFFLNNFLLGIAEVPAYIYVILLVNKIGRKIVIISAMVVAGVILIITVFIPKKVTWVMTVLVTLGKMSISASFSVIYMYSGEVFPTAIRSSSIGAGAMFSRLGAMISPQILLLEEYTFAGLSRVIFGVSALVSGISVVWTPETLNKRFPDTMDEAEAL